MLCCFTLQAHHQHIEAKNSLSQYEYTYVGVSLYLSVPICTVSAYIPELVHLCIFYLCILSVCLCIYVHIHIHTHTFIICVFVSLYASRYIYTHTYAAHYTYIYIYTYVSCSVAGVRVFACMHLEVR